jgi:N6-adenosine-specific RNA methylase IME4
MKTHPAAEEFPLMPDDRLRELAEDISRNGQREPIKLFDGLVIDGRNRLRACELLGIEPTTETLPRDINPFAYVWSLNGERRDLLAGQRYAIWDSCQEKSGAWQAEQQRIQDEANTKRAEAVKARERRDDGTLTSAPTRCGQTGSDADRSKAAKAKAMASGTNRGTVERMDWLKRQRPDLWDEVRTGAMSDAAGVREAKRAETIERLEGIAAKEAKAAQGLYDVIVIDPPWQMEKIERDARPNQSQFDYPTMTEEELAQLTIPAAEHCHIWVWTTHKHLPMAFRLLDAWGLKYVCTFVWHKPGGFQPVGLPQYNCEFALYARKGAPNFIDTKAFPVCFDAARGKHSEKPEPFYELINRVTAGRRLDMFGRRLIDGFDSWGKEAA